MTWLDSDFLHITGLVTAMNYVQAAEYFKLAGDLYYCALAMCFNIMLTHGHMPPEATTVILFCPRLTIINI